MKNGLTNVAITMLEIIYIWTQLYSVFNFFMNWILTSQEVTI